MKRLLLTVLVLMVPLPSLAEDILVSTQWLSTRLDNPELVIIDMSEDPQYQRFHIRKAVSLPYSVLNQRIDNASFSIGPEKLSRILGLLGIRPDSHVVIYDDMGGLHASRFYWELERLGHKRISILDGGLVKWILEALPVTNQPFQNTAVTYPVISQPKRHSLATLDEIKNSRNSLLIDVRSQEEYTGHPRQPRSGHIPGARWWEWDNAVDFQNGFRFRDSAEITAQLKDILPADKNRPVTLYCQSGHRAAHAYVSLRRLGYQDVRLYDGSMAEYSQQKSLPLTLGTNP